LSYDAIYGAIKGRQGVEAIHTHAEKLQSKSGNPQSRIAYTIEFHPEEGKYHYAGHRTCNVRYGPEESKKKGSTCPVCGKPLTQGVVQRVEELAGRSEEDLKLSVASRRLSENGPEISMTVSKTFPDRPPFVMLVPLQEIIAEAIGSPVASIKTQSHYFRLTDTLGGEFNVFFGASGEDIARVSTPQIAAGVEKVRAGEIVIDPGYDGVFGIVRIWKEGEASPLVDTSKEQLGLF
jgi:PHP family Zn ribbon phosphoesterase